MEVLTMPLVKSPSSMAFRKNIKAEVKAGKPINVINKDVQIR